MLKQYAIVGTLTLIYSDGKITQNMATVDIYDLEHLIDTLVYTYKSNNDTFVKPLFASIMYMDSEGCTYSESLDVDMFIA